MNIGLEIFVDFKKMESRQKVMVDKAEHSRAD
jgi:hypothetical protein